MRNLLLLFLLLSTLSNMQAQELTGTWTGRLYQDDKDKSFFYEIKIQQNNDLITGNSYSLNEDNQAYARFSFTGAWDGSTLVIQEVKQTEPAAPKWCLKYISLKLNLEGDRPRLEGRWKADGCTPGRMVLESKTHSIETTSDVSEVFKPEGTWMGFLYQDDRNYGFYYEFDLEPGGKGSSYIVFEDNGGSARHAMDWGFDEKCL